MIRTRIARTFAVLFILFSSHAGAGPEAVHRVDLKSGIPIAMSVEPAPYEIQADSALPPQEQPPESVPALRKLHPLLLSSPDSSTTARDKVVIAFKDTVQIPRFPELDPRLPRNDQKNAPALAAAEKLVGELQEKRAESYLHAAELVGQYGGEIIETFWLINGVVAEMPRQNLLPFAANEEVLSIAPVQSAEPPPADDGDPLNDVEDGRARIESNPYFELSGGFIGLLDTGIRSTHRQFNGPSTIDLKLDCVKGSAYCRSGSNPDDDCWNHGTSTAAILTGNERAGIPFRGVTKITVDGFKVYPSVFDGGACDDIASGLDTAAAVHGFQAAVAALDKVIVAEIQQDLHNGPISRAANAAFDAGAVVVAANGNRRTPDEKVASPAEASRVLGVGNFDVKTGGAISSQRSGPTKDGRVKPDLQAPTNTETAGNGCLYLQNCSKIRNDEAFRTFGGTSGATPYAAGAAALMRNLVAQVTKINAVDPGFVYALMILSGQRTKFDNDHGVGWLQLTRDGSLLWGAIDVRHGGGFEIPVEVLPSQKIIDAALWWPEHPESHNNVDLTIDGPKGKHEESTSIDSVFERARITGASEGKWRIGIRGKTIRRGGQRVYFAILVKP